MLELETVMVRALGVIQSSELTNELLCSNERSLSGDVPIASMRVLQSLECAQQLLNSGITITLK